MTQPGRFKEEFYLRLRFDDEVPVFVDATRYVHLGLPYPLASKRSLKATCAVRTDDEVVAFSLRGYTGKQAEKEVENIGAAEGGKAVSTNLIRPRVPRKTLYDLHETARSLTGFAADEVVAELNDELYLLSLTRTGGGGELRLSGRLRPSGDGHERLPVEEDAAEFELPITGVRLRIFLRSPVRDRILAYGFSGYLTRRPGEVETVVRAASLALNSVLGLATFRMLSGLDRVEVPSPSPAMAIRSRRADEQVSFELPVVLFTDDGTPAARGRLLAEVDLDHVDPVTGRLRVQLSEREPLDWNPALAAPAGSPETRLDAYREALATTVAAAVHEALGEEAARDIAYGIVLADLPSESVATLRTACAGFPALVAKPGQAEVRATRAISGAA